MKCTECGNNFYDELTYNKCPECGTEFYVSKVVVTDVEWDTGEVGNGEQKQDAEQVAE